jgi:uncharacterized protein YjeT (DUF2065 family)
LTEFLTALCLAVAIEGIAYAAFPDAMRRTMAMIAQFDLAPDRTDGRDNRNRRHLVAAIRLDNAIVCYKRYH